MNTEKIKSEIRKSIEGLLEGVLVELLEYLNQMNSAKSDEIQRSKYLSKILKKDPNLLRRHAE